MFKIMKTAALTALFGAALGLGSLAAAPAAHADGIYFSIGQGHNWHNGQRHHWRRHAARSCTPRQAVRKAERSGIRRAYVSHVGRNAITVRGHRHRDRARIVFARAPHCPVIRAR